MGELLGIAIRSKSRAPMEELDSREVSSEAGLAGDFRGRAKGRNVTVLSREGWEAACADLGERLPWTTRRANLLVEGVDLAHSAGRQLRVGAVLLEITDECAPCQRMEDARSGLRAVLGRDWRAGVVCSVVEGGKLRVGDSVALEPD